MPHAWYLSADIQLYTLCYILIILLYKRPNIGVPISILLIISSMGALIWYIGGPLKGFPCDLDFELGRRLIYKNHFDPINHYGSYIIGLLLGYFMAKDIVITRRYLPYIYFVGLNLYTMTLIVPMFILALPDEVPWIESNQIGALIVDYFRQRPTLIYYLQWINISVQRQNFSTAFAAICYLLYASTKKSDDHDQSSEHILMSSNLAKTVLNSIELISSNMMTSVVDNLSNKYFVIFGRMSYSIFMTHYFVIAHYMSSPTSNISFSVFETLVRACYVYVVSISLGIVMFMSVEAPFVGMLKSIGGKSKTKSE